MNFFAGMLSKAHRHVQTALLFLVALVTCAAIWAMSNHLTTELAARNALAEAKVLTVRFENLAHGIQALGRAPAPATLDSELRDAMRQTGVVRYKLFDAKGLPVFDTAGDLGGGGSLATHNAIAAKIALSGQYFSKVVEKSERLIAEIYAPVMHNGKIAGVQEFYLDQTDKLTALKALVSSVTLMACLIAALAFGFPAWLWSRRSRLLEAREHTLDLQARSFKSALDHLPAGVSTFDRDGNLVTANQRYTSMFALDPDKVKPGLSYIVLRDMRMANSAPVRSEIPPGRNADDPLRNSREVWETNDGRTLVTTRYPAPDGGWVAVHEDITDRLAHEKEIEQAHHFLDTVIDNIPGAVIVKDAQTLTYQLINKEVEKIIGLPREEIVGKTAEQLFPAEHAAAITLRDRDALAANDSCLMARENAVVTPGHGERIIRTKRMSLRGRDNEPGHLLMVTEDVTEKRRAEEKIAWLAERDTLTGLFNRTYFKGQVETSLAHLRECDSIALISLDLDGFKEINDTFGHAAGDDVLRGTAERLRAIFDRHDVIARLGGDEFAIMCRSTPGEQMMHVITQRMIETLREPFLFEDRKVRVEASIGVAFGSGLANDYDLLMRQADVALYEAKGSGKGIYKMFDAEMMARRLKRKTIEAELHTAIAEDHFVLHYQPIVDLNSGKISSLEALVRWRHPEKGMVPPMEFIPIAEESGLIVRIGEVVLEKACADAIRWPSHTRVSVNLSPIQFRDKTLPEKIAAVLAKTGLPPQRLELEITEAALLVDSIDNISILTQLRETGIRIVMDDFGTGYSSLNYLRSFPFDKIKIDRSYVRDLEQGHNQSRTILDAVVAMARGLDLSTTAEGVETQEQMNILKLAGCTEMQGYYFSRPLPGEDIDTMMTGDAGKQVRAA